MAGETNRDVVIQLLDVEDSSTDSMESETSVLSELEQELSTLVNEEEGQEDDDVVFQHLRIKELTQNVDINVKDQLGKTALHHAVEREREKLVCLLLDANAELLRDQEKKTPLDRAMDANFDIIASKIIQTLCSRLESARLSLKTREHAQELTQFLRPLVEAKIFGLVKNGRMIKTVVAMLDFISIDGKPDFLLDKPVELDVCRLRATTGLSTFHLIALRGDQELATHAVVKEITRKKWLELRTVYYLEALINLLAMICLMVDSSLAVIEFNPQNSVVLQTPARRGLAIFLLSLYGIAILREVNQIVWYKKFYIRDKWNMLDISTIISSATLICLRVKPTAGKTFPWITQSVVYFLFTARMLQYYAVSENLSVYLNVMWNMKWQLFCFILVWGSLYLMFIGTFVITLPYYNDVEDVQQIFDRNSTVENRTTTLARICVLVLRTILDDEPTEKFYGGLNSGHTLAIWPILILSTYSLMTIVFLLAVLVAQVTNQYSTAEVEARIYYHCNRAQIVTSIELVPRCVQQCTKWFTERIACCVHPINRLYHRVVDKLFGGFEKIQGKNEGFEENRGFEKSRRKQRKQEELVEQVKEIRGLVEVIKDKVDQPHSVNQEETTSCHRNERSTCSF